MKASIAIVTIRGTAPLSQSRMLPPRTRDESGDAFDARVWREKGHYAADGRLLIPAHGIHQCLIAAASYLNQRITGQGKRTWKGKFEKGIVISDDAETDQSFDTAVPLSLAVSAQGRRGIGPRVTRTFPVWPQWRATFECYILDPLITRRVFEDHLETAGFFVGLGRFRPEVGGMNGRFVLQSLDWQDNRDLVRVAA